MRRLAPLNRALVAILVPLWLVCFGLSIKTQLHGGQFPRLALSVEDGASYPAVTGVFFFTDPQGLENAGLRRSDLLVRVGRADLRGVGALGFAGRAIEEAGRDPSVALVYERGGERRETSFARIPDPYTWPTLAFSFASP